MHYVERDLIGAVRSYTGLIASHPSATEAGYSRAQVKNIVNLVVPDEELLRAQMDLALRHLQPAGDVRKASSLA
jgi:hypothetical protein